jgi:hypothetical protein
MFESALPFWEMAEYPRSPRPHSRENFKTSKLLQQIIWHFRTTAAQYNVTTNDRTTNECYREQFSSIKSGCYNEHHILQQTQRSTIGRRSTRVRMTWRAFLLWQGRQSSSLLSFVRFSYQFSSVVCLFVPFLLLFCYIILVMSRQNRVRKLINLDIKKEIISKRESRLFLHLYFVFSIIFFLFKWLCWMITLL